LVYFSLPALMLANNHANFAVSLSLIPIPKITKCMKENQSFPSEG
jgi:hypothetical protein